MIDGKLLVEKLLKYANTFLSLDNRDIIYFRNLLLREFKLDGPCTESVDLKFIESLDVPDILVNDLEAFAIENNLCKEEEKNLYSTYILGILSPIPSKVNSEFRRIKDEKGIIKACEYFYNLSVKNNYVQKTAISKNLKWEYKDGSKTLEITINLSKPEKSNKDIAKLLLLPKTSNKYPSCLLCKENEGFAGTLTHPARENIRTISLDMGGEPWFVQYSPYAYFNEHLIAINEEHVPMCVCEKTIDKLLDFVDFFPNYMIGSNASLPIIGGSILNHEHFQGGEHLMPMHYAPSLKGYDKLKCKYGDVKVSIVDWYNSVIRLVSKNRKHISEIAKNIVGGWQNFSCKACNIIAKTEDNVVHNSCSPVCRKNGKDYIFDIILRNNITTEEYPEGLFHAHPEYHNIKKEGIGLIEAMGLFILPGRLKTQLNDIADILCGNVKFDEKEFKKDDHPLRVHFDMITDLLKCGIVDSKAKAETLVKDRINVVCKNILDNTAVFKKDENGFNGFVSFLNSVNIK